MEKINWTRVKNDVNGNPRYVCHFLEFISSADSCDISEKYQLALNRAKELGGKKFHNKQYGGGVVFQSYNIADLEKQIHNLMHKVDMCLHCEYKNAPVTENGPCIQCDALKK